MMNSIVCRQAITWLAFCCLMSGIRVSMAQETTDSAGTATETAGAADGGASAAEEPQASASGDVETEAESEATGGGESTESAGEDTADSEAAVEEEEPEIVIPPPFKSMPYSVHVAVAFNNRCFPDQERRDDVIRRIRYAIARMYGRMWDVDVVENQWMHPAHKRHLDWLSTETMIERYPEVEYHKAFMVTVEPAGPGYRVSCREFDSRVQELGPIQSRATLDGRAVPSITTELLRDSFRPCVLFLRNYTTESGRPMMELQVQAGEIIPPDPSAEQVVENDVLRTFVRQMDRRDPNKMTNLLKLDLTYVRVMEVDRGEASDAIDESSGSESVAIPVEAEGTETAADEPETGGGYAPGRIQGFFVTHSSYSPFGGKGRRVQHLALRQRPSAETSKVKIVLRGRHDKPLVSHRLALAYQLHWKDEEDGDQTQLVSDRNGEVLISQREGHPTFWIRVYSGASLLARVPYAPGLIPSDIIELPDDSIRLGVEGEIQLLADELVDAIALRGVLLARAKKAADAGDVDGFNSLIERQAAVPEKEYFLSRIKNIEIPAVRKCEERRLSPTFSVRLCEGLRTTVTRFFTDESRAERQREISGLRARVGQNAGGN